MAVLYDTKLIGCPLEEILEKSSTSINHYKITKDQRNLIENSTRKQHRSELWNQCREGRITGSSIHAVTRTRVKNPSKSLVQKVVRPKEVQFSSKPTQSVIFLQIHK